MKHIISAAATHFFSDPLTSLRNEKPDENAVTCLFFRRHLNSLRNEKPDEENTGTVFLFL